jgi:hypothetical protein
MYPWAQGRRGPPGAAYVGDGELATARCSGRSRGPKSKTAKSLPDHQNRRSDVWERGDLCNMPNKSGPAKNGWGREHLRAAKGAHHGCQVYEGKERKKSLKTTKSNFGTFDLSANLPSPPDVPSVHKGDKT